MMELLIIKSGTSYIRVKEETYHRVNLDKASVFPLDQIDTVRGHVDKLGRSGFAAVQINKLVINEEPYKDS